MIFHRREYKQLDEKYQALTKENENSKKVNLTKCFLISFSNFNVTNNLNILRTKKAKPKFITKT